MSAWRFFPSASPKAERGGLQGGTGEDTIRRLWAVCFFGTRIRGAYGDNMTKKHFLPLAFALLLALSAAAVGGEGKATLFLYTWSDYFDPDVLDRFEEEFDCHVAIDYFDSNEAMYAKLKAGAAGHDVVTPSSYMSAVMHQQGMLRVLDHSLLPNLRHIDDSFVDLAEDKEMVYSVPYTRSVSGVGYNRAQLGELEPTWDVFSRADLSKRMTMLNDMRETIGAALQFLGYSLNTRNSAELEEAGRVLRGWKKNLAKFEVDEAKIGLGSGEFLVIHGYNGDIALIMEENEDIDFFVPAEGASTTYDDFAILSDAKNVDLAYAFINFFLDPDNAADNMEGIRYYMPNREGVEKVSEELRENPAFNTGSMEKCEVIRDLGEDNAKYVRIWDQVKAADD